VWFLIREIRSQAEKLPYVGERLPRWFWNVFASTVLFAVAGVVVNMIFSNMQDLSDNLHLYEKNLQIFNKEIESKYSLNLYNELKLYYGEFNLSSIISFIISSLTDIFSDFILILLYILFFFVEETVFDNKIARLFPHKTERFEAEINLKRFSDTISRYISLKTFVSFITGFASYIVLIIIGVDSALFWSFLIFILNFIPNIGSLVATVFPAMIALFQFGDSGPFFMILLLVGTIQMIVGNIIEPRIMGNSLNLSALVVLLSLVFWGLLWGIIGMAISVPLTVILVILLGQFESTKPVAILLSEKGEIADDELL
jgi:predicted PurR-regulated permease PerM